MDGKEEIGFTVEQQLLNILVDIQRRNIGLEVGKNRILHLFNKFDETTKETDEWLERFRNKD